MSKTSQYQSKQLNAEGLIAYSEDENAIWARLYARQQPRLVGAMAPDYLTGFEKLALPSDRIPQCPEVSQILQDLTGWQVTPVPHLIPFQRFFDMLANRQFPAASFIRNAQDFDYVQEPDIFHEIFGHAPLLTDSRYAAFSQAIGKAGQRAEAKDYAWLIRLYWFSIEFGLIRVKGEIKALGSGLASSPTEIIHATQNPTVQRRAFNLLDMLRTPYRIDIHQPVYFVIDHADDLFRAADCDLLAQVSRARSLGLFAPTYPPRQKAS